jgi:hypothetical protein
MEPWQQYMKELRQRAARIPDDAFGRGELMAEAAHDAYQKTTNQLTAQGWDEVSALTVTRMFGQAVKNWIATGAADWTTLESELRTGYTAWNDARPET